MIDIKMRFEVFHLVDVIQISKNTCGTPERKRRMLKARSENRNENDKENIKRTRSKRETERERKGKE